MKKIYILIVLFSISLTLLSAESILDLELNSYNGFEYNIYKSPDSLLDLNTDTYFLKDTLIISDYFWDFGYDTKYRFNKENNYLFSVASDFWYRKYFNHPNADQKRFSFTTSYEKILSKYFSLGAEYDFSWNDKLGTSIFGDELLRSYKFLGNKGELYLDIIPSDDFDMTISGMFLTKTYYQDTTGNALDNNEFRLDFAADYQIFDAHTIQIGFGFEDRTYKYYNSSDSLGHTVLGSPLRHFQVYNGEVNYKYKPVSGLIFSTGLDFTRRVDLYQDYYSYTSYSPNIRARYFDDKWNVILKTAFKQSNYDKRYAYTDVPNTELLIYQYMEYDAKVQFKVLKFLELYFDFTYDDRTPNAELDSKKVRRSYTNYEALFGVNIILFDQ